jgi:hypothetical protein
MSDTHPKDKIQYKYNVIEDTFDMVAKFNENRILTAQYGNYGFFSLNNPNHYPEQLPFGPVVITDNNGNVVVVGD